MKVSRVIRVDIGFANMVDEKIKLEVGKGNHRFSQVDATRFFTRKIKDGGFFTILREL